LPSSLVGALNALERRDAMRKLMTLGFLMAGFAALMLVGTAAAGESPIVNDTTVSKSLSGVDLDANPCTGSPAINYHSGRATFHTTAFADGTVHVTVVFHMDFLVDTIDPAGVDFSGHETDTFSFDGTNGAATLAVTFTPILAGTDGTRLVGHETGHVTVTADGVVAVSFDHFTFVRGCP
jgi:hypothetical protein